MKGSQIFNSVLVLSFIFSSLGGPMAVHSGTVQAGNTWNTAAIFEGVRNWLDGLQVFQNNQNSKPAVGMAPTATPPVGTVPTETSTPFLSIPPLETPTPELTLSPTPTTTNTATPAITPTLEITATLEPTISPLPTTTNTTVPTITSTPEPTLTPESTLSPTMASTEVITATLTPTPGKELNLALFDVTLEPDPAAPGDVVTATWVIHNLGGQLDGVEIWLHLPEDFIPLEIGEGTYDPATNLLILPIRAANGILSWFIDGNAEPPFDIPVEIHKNGQVIFSTTRTLGMRGPDIVPIEGGEAHGFNRHVKVDFEAGALPEAADIKVRPPHHSDLTLGGNPFELTAIGRDTGMEITQFSQPVTITIQYTDEEAARQLEYAGVKDESSLTLFYYDEVMGTWHPLTTTVDAEANELTAFTDHFTIFDYKAQNWEAARLPSLDSFQVAGFTGAASYSFPIQVPPGPGGLQPSLELTYNSQTVDSASSRAQASWAGMGWSLGTGYIQRNMNGTPSYFDDDTFSLEMNGVGGLLLPIADQDSDPNTIDYHFEAERFWRVRQYLVTGNVGGYPGDTGYWVVWDPNGTQYYFGNYTDGGTSGHAWYPAYPSGCASITMQTWRWSMTRVRNSFGQELTYNYNTEAAPSPKFDEGCSGYRANMAVAMYPDTIIYPNNRYRVLFIREANGSRTDYDPAWNDAQSTIFYMRAKLLRIEIWQDPNGTWNSGDEVMIRKYVLGYGERSQQIYPNLTWPAGGKTPTLTSITEYGLNGTNSLPATKFTYDGMHLTVGDNGYGGNVEFEYTEWNAAAGSEHFDGGSWSYTTGEYYPDDVVPYGNDLDWLKTLYQPGGAYLIVANVWPTQGSSSAKLGVDDGTAHVYGSLTSLTWGQWNTFSSIIVISSNASKARGLFYCSGGCNLDTYKVYPLLTRYRVSAKVLSDVVTGSSYTYQYSYTGAAVNDTGHSAIVNTYPDGSHLMTPPNTEFRGHSQVTETDPDGRVVVTSYNQDDIYKGQTTLIEVKNSSGNVYTKSITVSNYQGFATYNLPHPAGQPSNYYQDLKILWVYTTSEESRTNNGDAAYVASRNDYQYNTADQGGTQYGNRTRSLSSYWNNSAWVTYRGSVTVYYPKVSNGTPESSRYLVGLPGYTNTYQCPGGCDWAGADSLSSHWYLYDNHTMYNDLPDDGKLTGERRLIYSASPPTGDLRYADTSYAYDAWGNQTSVIQYTDDTNFNGFGSGIQSQTTTRCYGSGTAPSCSSDGYNTYLAWEKNALGHAKYYTYDKARGVPTSLTDPNNATTSATYDEFARLLTIVRPGDDANNPTARMSYHTASTPSLNNPFWTEAQQRITGSMYFTLRKYYNGIGQLLQTQVVGATIGTQTRDILTDTFYDSGGRVYRQSVPYDVATGSNYHQRSTSAAYTQTTYDVLGRTTNIMATDSSHTVYAYDDGYISNVPYLYTTETNPRGYSTTTKSDVWGRAVLVTPPTGPTVSYTYDAADRLLTTVRGGATTTLTYDFGSRKTQMVDPDMGTWTYTYDAFGNLKTQTDARACVITLGYDALNRLTGKSYSGACSGTAVTNTYDVGTNGKGHRTGMGDGSGSTSWTYDSRGRMTQETKVVTGSGTFVTQWGYNSADLMTWLKYPADNNSGEGETVNYTYQPQMLINSVIGTNTYVYSTDYDAAGRVDMRRFGTNGLVNLLQADYVYYPWTTQNGQGRVQQILSGLDTDTDSLQDLRYTYDDNGDVLTIQDYKAGSPQAQTFTYDALDRLASGQAAGGSGGTYSLQNYTYNSTTGNLASQAGASYTYNTTTPSPAHGVRRANGTGGSSKTITIRAYSTPCNDGVGATMELWVNGSKAATWANVASSWTNYSQSVTLSGKDVIDVVFTNDCGGGGYDRNLFVDYVIVDGTTIQAEGGAAIIDIGSGTAAFDGQNVVMGGQGIYWSGALRLVKGDGGFIGGYDANGNLTSRVVNGAATLLSYDAENHLVSVSGAATASFVYDGDGNRIKGTVAGNATTYLGNYFEWTGSTSTMKKYYYAGSTRVAMRTGSSTLNYLLGDHLGSTSITTNSSGAYFAEIRYMPWGTARYISGTTPTTFQFTGQRLDNLLGLYFYNARWYDPLLGRFIQADTITPGGVQGLDRYVYVGNNPVRYTDPTGHDACDEEGNCYNTQGWYRARYAKRLSTIDTWKMMIWGKFGVTMSEENNRAWSNTNLETVYLSLGMTNNKLGGNLKSMICGTTFTITDGGNQYYGQTSPLGVDFHTASSNTELPSINILHETGHLLDMVPTTSDVFSNPLAEEKPSWVDKNGYVDRSLLLNKFYQPVQAKPLGEAYDPSEYWADAFANYVADNINLNIPNGSSMYSDVNLELDPYR